MAPMLAGVQDEVLMTGAGGVGGVAYRTRAERVRKILHSLGTICVSNGSQNVVLISVGFIALKGQLQIARICAGNSSCLGGTPHRSFSEAGSLSLPAMKKFRGSDRERKHSNR